MTRAETLLWRYLKTGHLEGLSFRRQTPIGRYIVDFVCHAARLVVEIDGETHAFAEQIEHDQRRDGWLASRGHMVVRFANDEVMHNSDGVLATIKEIARGRAPSTPLPSPPSQGGREHVCAGGSK